MNLKEREINVLEQKGNFTYKIIEYLTLFQFPTILSLYYWSTTLNYNYLLRNLVWTEFGVLPPSESWCDHFSHKAISYKEIMLIVLFNCQIRFALSLLSYHSRGPLAVLFLLIVTYFIPLLLSYFSPHPTNPSDHGIFGVDVWKIISY